MCTVSQPQIYIAYAREMSPYEYNKDIQNVSETGFANVIFVDDDKDIDTNGVYILYKYDKMQKVLLEDNFNILEFGNYILLYK